MRTKQTLAIAIVFGLALASSVFANVSYNNEVTNDWFSVDASAAVIPGSGWTKPTEGTVDTSGDLIKLDTELTDPLVYTPAAQIGDGAIVSVSFEATANASEPTFTEVPQAALTVIAANGETNWWGLVGGDSATWTKFSNVIPTVGSTYDVKIEFDQVSTTKRIRYSVGGTVLGNGWYNNPQGSPAKIQSVSFAGTGDIGDFDGKTVVEAAAGFNGQNYTTFAAALAAAEASTAWSASNPVVLYDDAAYQITATKSVFFNANGHTLTITGGAVVQNGNTYNVTVSTECEAKIGDTFYATFAEAVEAVQPNETITLLKGATFAYAGTPLASVVLQAKLSISGLSAVAEGTTIIAAISGTGTYEATDLPAAKCLEIQSGKLVVATAVEITVVDDDDGIDYTNGTVSVTATAKTDATATLTVVGWDGVTIKSHQKSVTSGTPVTWDVAEVMEGALTQGGAYTYTVDIKVGGETVATRKGEFTAAKWGADGAWFIADATTTPATVDGGHWAGTAPTITDNKYAVNDSTFTVTSAAGEGKFTRVDTKVTFETLVDGEVDVPEGTPVGGFVATTAGWKAFDGTAWVTLTRATGPAVNTTYVIRAEFDFAAETTRMRYFVKEGNGDFVPLWNGNSQWVTAGTAAKLTAVEFQGSGSLESIKATVADKALASVGGTKYDNMADALAAGGSITLLTNVTVKPTAAGSWTFVKGGYNVTVDLSALKGGKAVWDGNTLTVTAGVGATYMIW